MVKRYDEITLNDTTKITPEGFLETTAIVTRTGIFEYVVDGKVRREFRPDSEVFSQESLNSMQLKPVTVGHPSVPVTSKTIKQLQVGSVGQNVRRDGQYVKAPIVITDEAAINDIKNGRNKISMGYNVEMVEEAGVYQGERYDAIQTKIRYNHLAIVDRARAGNAAQIKLDRADGICTSLNETKKEGTMTKKIRIDNADYEVEPQVAAGYNDALDKVTELSNKNKDLQIKIEKLDGEIDGLKKANNELSTRDFSKEVANAAIKRTELLTTVKSVCDGETYNKISGLSDIEIKRALITKEMPDAKIETKSDEYVEACFDTMINFRKDKNFQNQRIAAFGIDTIANTRTVNDGDTCTNEVSSLVQSRMDLRARLEKDKQEDK